MGIHIQRSTYFVNRKVCNKLSAGWNICIMKSLTLLKVEQNTDQSFYWKNSYIVDSMLAFNRFRICHSYLLCLYKPKSPKQVVYAVSLWYSSCPLCWNGQLTYSNLFSLFQNTCNTQILCYCCFFYDHQWYILCHISENFSSFNIAGFC